MAVCPRSCPTSTATLAKQSFDKLLARARAKVNAKAPEVCQRKLKTAIERAKAAARVKDPCEYRAALVRASFDAGQALSCAVVERIKVGRAKVAPASKRRRSKSR